MRPQKLTKIQSNQFKNQSDIIFRTHLKSLIDEDPGGKNAVLILICAKDEEWLTSFLSYQEAKRYFGEKIGSSSNYSEQTKLYQSAKITDKRSNEKTAMKKRLRKYLKEIESK